MYLSYHYSLNWVNIITNHEKSALEVDHPFFYLGKLRTSTQNDTEIQQRVKS